MRHHLPEYSLECSRDVLVAFVHAPDFALQLFWRRLCQHRELTQKLRKPRPEPIPLRHTPQKAAPGAEPPPPHLLTKLPESSPNCVRDKQASGPECAAAHTPSSN